MRIEAGLAEDVVKKALRRGADHAEVYMKTSRGLVVEVREGAVDSLKSSHSAGYSLRVIRDGRLGFSYSTDGAKADSMVEAAMACAAYADEDRFLDVPVPAPLRDIDVYDPAVSEITEEGAIARVMDTERAVFATDLRIRRVRKAMGSFTTSETVIANSRGVRVSYRSSSCGTQVTAVAEESGESQVGWEYESSRRLSDVSFDEVGRTAARRAVRLLGARKMTGCKAHVILDNSVTVDFLGIFASSFSSEAVQKGKSLLAGKQGLRAVSPMISMWDSGLLPWKAGSSPADAEGVPASEKTLIREGVVDSYLYNTYTAGRDGVSSTGNAVRGGFASMVSVGITNLFLDASSAGDRLPFGDIFRGIEKGLYVTDAMGVHTANPISGEFSVGVTGLWVEGGEIRYPVREAVISGTILEFFSRVEAIADDLRFYGNVGAPSLVIGGVDISA